jgi:ubiquinone/menaquinone biosynthesis C-methylase UbiE
MAWKPSEHYDKVVEANRLYYKKTASLYDATETCVRDGKSQKMLQATIDELIGLLDKDPAKLTALDACGGSGNVALKLLERGIQVTLCDVSEDLLMIFLGKLQSDHPIPHAVCSEIASFLADTSTTYDIIIFSSALHHLENIESVLLLAYERLKPGGVLLTVFDPTSRHTIKLATEILLRIDYIMFKVCSQPSDLSDAVMRRIRRTLLNSSRDKHTLDIRSENLGVLAEYHVDYGIDDLALVQFLKSFNIPVVKHERYAGGRYAIIRWLIRLFRDVTTFKLIVQKPA